MPKPAKENERLEPLIGEWSMAVVMPGEQRPAEPPDVGARVTFEWLGDKAFVIERWTVPVPEAPDGWPRSAGIGAAAPSSSTTSTSAGSHASTR